MEKFNELIETVKVMLEEIIENSNSITEMITQFKDKMEEVKDNAVGKTQQAVARELLVLKKKLDVYINMAQEWLDQKVDEANAWIKEQVAKVKAQLSRVKAKKLVAKMECATKTKLPEQVVNELIKQIPPVPLEIPNIPYLKIPELI